MLEYVAKLLTVDQFTVLVVAALAGLSGYVMKQMVSATMLTVLFIPGFVAGALASIYVFREFGIAFGSEKDANIVVASGVGIIVALIIMLLVTRLVMSIGGMRRAVTK